MTPRTKRQLIDFLAQRRQDLGGSVSEHNNRRLLATRTKAELQAQYARIVENERRMRLVLLYSWVANNLHVLVPKKRGTGYLAVPYGHHPDPGLDHIAAVTGVDVTGLDGALCFEGSPRFQCNK